MNLAGLVGVVVEQASGDYPAPPDVVVDLALSLLRAGASPPLSAFEDPVERSAWIEAGHRLEVERAQRIALALRGDMGAALAAADLDGGVSAARVAGRELARAVARGDL